MMKTGILILLSSGILFPSYAGSQLLRGYGVKVGAISATQTWDYNVDITIDAERRWGLDVGGYVELFDTPYLSLLGEVHYVQKGFTFTAIVSSINQPDGTGEYLTVRPRVDYLSLPLLIKLRFDMQVVSPYVIVGPRLDLLIAKDPQGFQAVLNEFKAIDVGLSLGAGAEVPTSFLSSVLLEFRYSPTFNTSFSNAFLTVRNQSFELLLGVRF
jgi:hypothetical protein